LKGKPINTDILQYIGKPSEIIGILEKPKDWYILKIDTNGIKELNIKSSMY